MATQVQFRGGTTAQNNAFTGASKELTVDTDKDVVVVHDGATAGGHPLMAEDGSNSALAFGTAGTPALKFTGTSTGIYSPGADQLAISTNGTGRLFVDADGNVEVGNQRFYVDNTNGRVGIGTTSPAHKLVVDTGGGGVVNIKQASGSSVSGALEIVRNAGDSSTKALQATTTDGECFNVTYEGGAYLKSSIAVGDSLVTSEADIEVRKDSSILSLRSKNTTTGKSVLLLGDNTNSYVQQIVSNHSDNSLSFHTGATSIGDAEHARIDSSGRLLVGTSTSIDNSVEGAIQVVGGGADSCVSLTRYNSTATGSPILVIGRSKSDTKGANDIVADDDSLGRVNFTGADGSDFIVAAEIAAEVDGTPGANDMPGRLVFSTTADGASSPTERLIINSQGFVFPDQTSANNVDNYLSTSVGGFRWVAGTTTTTSRAESYGSSTTTRYHQTFVNPNGTVGSISTSASATAYNTSSDYRLKENVVPLTGAIDRVNQLQVHRFNFIADSDTTVDGFIAHEAQAIVPECVTGEKDGVDDEGNPVYQGIDQSKLVPLLTAALQEALAEIESLKARVTALEP